MSEINGIAKEIVKTIREDKNKGTKPYDTQATVMRVEDGTAWVRIPGGVDETPAQLTMDAKEGDNVQVRVSGGRAWLAGNGTSPPTDDTKAVEANENAKSASIAARAAFNAAENAQTDAERAHYAAEQAETDAAEAKTSATNASEYASRALGNLSTVQSVTETLNWITAHGTMTLTSDTALDPSHVYFVRNNDGDYVVGGNHYSVVTEPSVDNVSTYYELTIDESLNNYVGTHLSVTSEGLWLLPDAGGNKVLIATGQGQTYTSAGTYIVGKVNGVDTVLASFLASGVQIGQDSESHLNMDYHSMQLIDKEGNPYFYVSDLRDVNGNITERFEGDSSGATDFRLMVPALSIVSVTVNGESVVSRFSPPDAVYLDEAAFSGDEVEITYEAGVSNTKAYTLGVRSVYTWKSAVGIHSVAEGYDVTASGRMSHAEGRDTVASEEYSHAEGYYTRAEGPISHAEGLGSVASGTASHAEGNLTEASGTNSHAQNEATIAASKYQTALGKYNIADNNATYSVIIGNGNENQRSNALTVDWQGNVKTAGSVTENNGTRDIDLTISETTIQKYVNLGMSLT